MTDEREGRTTQDERTGRWPWSRDRDEARERDRTEARERDRSRTELAERLSQRENEAEELRREVGAIPKCEPDPYCVPMNLQPDDPQCQPRPLPAQKRGSHIVGGHGRHR